MLLVVSFKFFVKTHWLCQRRCPNVSLPKRFADWRPRNGLVYWSASVLPPLLRPWLQRKRHLRATTSKAGARLPHSKISPQSKFASCPCRGGCGQLRFEIGLERVEPRRDSLRYRKFGGDRVCRL